LKTHTCSSNKEGSLYLFWDCAKLDFFLKIDEQNKDAHQIKKIKNKNFGFLLLINMNDDILLWLRHLSKAFYHSMLHFSTSAQCQHLNDFMGQPLLSFEAFQYFRGCGPSP
jgi:hypothetical protein